MNNLPKHTFSRFFDHEFENHTSLLLPISIRPCDSLCTHIRIGSANWKVVCSNLEVLVRIEVWVKDDNCVCCLNKMSVNDGGRKGDANSQIG
jgi:hypothetical protein